MSSLPVREAVVELHLALDHEHDLVARVEMEFAAVFAATRHEGQRIVSLPKHLDPLAGPRKLVPNGHQIGDRHG
jgi:hypothetical protein